MPRRFITQPSFNGVAAGGTATIDLPNIDIYHQLRLHYVESGVDATQANMELDIEEVRLVVNGKVQRIFNARQLFDINGYRGIGVDSGFLPIFFSEPWRRSVQGEDALAWGMADVDTFQVEVDIVAGATTPILTMSAIKETGSRPMGPIVKWRRYTVPIGATGVHNLSTLPKEDAYYGLHCDSSVITSVEVNVDNVKVFDNIVRADLVDYYAQQGFVMPADWTMIDWSATGRVSDVLSMLRADRQTVKDFRVDFTMSAATPFTMITETLGLRD